MLFFDLEFYVPPNARNDPNKRGTLIFNPGKRDHIILGGHFIQKRIGDRPGIKNIRSEQSFWVWNEGNEKSVLNNIYHIFNQEWMEQKHHRVKILHKTLRDIITVGIGISRIDLPSLYIRSDFHRTKSRSRLFEIFLKTKVIDLSNTGSFLFRNEYILYPKTQNELLRILAPARKPKKGGKGVWKNYEKHNYKQIEARCKEEVRQILMMYENLQKKITHQE